MVARRVYKRLFAQRFGRKRIFEAKKFREQGIAQRKQNAYSLRKSRVIFCERLKAFVQTRPFFVHSENILRRRIFCNQHTPMQSLWEGAKNSVADFNFEKLDNDENVAKKHFHYDKPRLFIAIFQR